MGKRYTTDTQMNSKELSSQTKLIRSGIARSSFDETSEGMFLTSGFVYSSAEEAEATFLGQRERYIYSRYGNPTVSMFEKRLAALEGAEHCQATASGMSAVYTSLIGLLQSGSRVVASRALFGSCFVILSDLLPRFGVKVDFVDGPDILAWDKALSTPCDVVFLESPSNPTLELIDIAHVSGLAKQAGAKLVVDNVFATPLYQKPLELGADVVVYSATKHIDGQGRVLGGAILCAEDLFREAYQPYIRHTGPSMSPFNAWVLTKSLETLSLRVDAQSDAAMALADWLEKQPSVASVRYPGHASHPQHALAKRQMKKFGTVLAFSVKDTGEGGKAAAFKMMNKLQLIDISNNLGDSKSLITHPATTTHRALSEEARLAVGIDAGLVRLSVGLEHVDDLRSDLERALS